MHEFAQSLGSHVQTLLYSLSERAIHTPDICPGGTRDPKLELNKNFTPPLSCWEYFPYACFQEHLVVKGLLFQACLILGIVVKPHTF